MHREKGAALIIVLSLLTVSLMLGLSSMQSALIDERLAGNYRAQAAVQMGAEEAASAGLEAIESADWVSLSASEVYSLEWSDVEGGADGGCQAPVSCYYRYIDDGGSQYIVSMGVVQAGGKIVSVSEPVFVKVEEVDSGMGNFASTSVIGNISQGAVQFPSSSASGLFGGEYEHEGEAFPVPSFIFEEGLDSYNLSNVLDAGSKAALNSDNTGYYSSDAQSRLNILKQMYDAHIESGGSVGGGGGNSSCSGVCFYENGLKHTGNGTLNGVHVVLDGDVQVGGNADIQGVLIVLNLGENSLSDGSWDEGKLGDVTKVKLNGGGNKGTVWFDEVVVKNALSSVGVNLESFFGSGGEGEGDEWRIESWM